MNTNSQNNSNDDEILGRLYKEGSKEMAPAKLNYEILQYAKNAEMPSGSASHFSGGWKVPLSLAASIVVVFGLFVQLDQSPQPLDLPPIPELSTSESPKQDPTNKEITKDILMQETCMS